MLFRSIDLYKAGRITGVKKTIDKGKSVYTFALGSKHLYDTIDRNPDFHNCPVERAGPANLNNRISGFSA